MIMFTAKTLRRATVQAFDSPRAEAHGMPDLDAAMPRDHLICVAGAVA
jgi:hypothetical protein